MHSTHACKVQANKALSKQSAPETIFILSICSMIRMVDSVASQWINDYWNQRPLPVDVRVSTNVFIDSDSKRSSLRIFLSRAVLCASHSQLSILNCNKWQLVRGSRENAFFIFFR